MTEKQRMTYNEPGDEYGENSKSSGRQRDLPCDAAGITGKGYSKTTRNAYGEPSPVHLGGDQPQPGEHGCGKEEAPPAVGHYAPRNEDQLPERNRGRFSMALR